MSAASQLLPTVINDQDGFLVEQARMGKALAYAELVNRHRTWLMRLAMKITKDMSQAEDVVQDSLIKAYTKLHMFQGKSSFRSWLYRITVNTSKNKLRSQKKEVVNIENVQISTSSEAENGMFESHLKVLLKEEINNFH